MEVQITGKGVELSKSLNSYIESSLESHVKKYFQKDGCIKVVLCRDGQLFHIDISVNKGIMNGILIKASANHNNPYSVVDSAIIRLSGKLRRYKHKLHSSSHKPKKSIKAMQSMIQQSFDVEEELHLNEQNAVESTPLITEEQTIDIQVLSVADAIMHLELTAVPALMFINVENHQINMVYKRKDGNVTWVEAPNVLDKLS